MKVNKIIYKIMFNFLQKINIDNLKMLFLKTFKRTPLSVFISLVTFILMVVIVRVENMSQVLEDNLHKAVFTLIVTFFFSVAMYLYSESRNITKNKKWFYQVATVVFGVLFYYFFEENLFSSFQAEVAVYFILTILGVISFVFIAPFICKLRAKNLGQEEFYISVYSLVIRILMSMITGVAVMILGFIAFSAIFTLFDIDFIDEDNWYAYWSAFSLVLFASIFFLVNLPDARTEESSKLQSIQSNKFYSFLINYVGLFAIFIYFLILYSYTIKVLINFSLWPQGEVAWLVILFSFFGYLIYFASFAFTNTFKPARLLRKFLPTAVILQTPMLFYAIGLRINQYDITINRYLVVAFGIWLFGLSLYFIISKKKGLSTPFYSLLIVIIFISIGPWSVYVVPEWRQLNNLKNNLEVANILETDGKIVPLEKYQDISGELSGEIYSGIDYLCHFHGCDTLDKYFEEEIREIKKEDREDFEENKKKSLERVDLDIGNEEYIESIKNQEYSDISAWKLVSELTEKIKVKRYYKDERTDGVPMNFSFRNNGRLVRESVDVSGYDFYVKASSDDFRKSEIARNLEDDAGEKDLSDVYRVTIDTSTKKLEIFLNDDSVEVFNIEETVIKPLLEKKNNSLEYERFGYEEDILLPSDDMTFNLQGVDHNLKLVLSNISIRNPEWVAEEREENDNQREVDMRIMTRTLNGSYVNAYVLIKTEK